MKNINENYNDNMNKDSIILDNTGIKNNSNINNNEKNEEHKKITKIKVS